MVVTKQADENGNVINLTPTWISASSSCSSRTDFEKEWPSAEDSICRVGPGSRADECRGSLHTNVSMGKRDVVRTPTLSPGH